MSGTVTTDVQYDQFAADAQQFGVSVNQVIEASGIEQEKPDEGVFSIWQENVASLELFLSCRSQWRILPGFDRAVYLGLDYSAVEVVIRQRCTVDKTEVFKDIQVMEWAALEVLNQD